MSGALKNIANENGIDGSRNDAVGRFLRSDHPYLRSTEALVYVPVLNEERTIAKVVEEIRNVCDFDVLVIDDGSTDATPAILQKLNVEVLRNSGPTGSRNVLTALEVSQLLGYRYVIKIDSDGQQDPKDIPRLWSCAVQTGANTVIGSRHLDHFSANIWSFEGSGMWFCAKLVSLLARKRITDATSGFRLWDRSAAQLFLESFNQGKMKDLTTFLVEELLITARKGLRIEEIDVVMHPRQFGESRCYSSAKQRLSFPFNLIRSTFRAYS